MGRHDTQEKFENAKYVLADLTCMKEWWHPVATCVCFYLQFTATSISKQSLGCHQNKGSVNLEIQLQFHTDKSRGVTTVEDSTSAFRKIPILCNSTANVGQSISFPNSSLFMTEVENWDLSQNVCSYAYLSKLSKLLCNAHYSSAKHSHVM